MKLELKDIEISTVRGIHQGNWGKIPSETAVRILHKPTGISVTEFSDRSVHRNKTIAYERLEKIVAMAKPINWDQKVKDLCGESVSRIINEMIEVGVNPLKNGTAIIIYDGVRDALFEMKELIKK